MGPAYKVQKWDQAFAPNPAMLRQILATEGYRVFQWCDQPGATYGWHSHADEQSHWVISGVLELNVRDIGTFVLEAGDRDFMPAGTYHAAQVIGEEPVIYLIGEKSRI